MSKNCKDLPFGGLNIVLTGDLFQVEPVMDKALFKLTHTSDAFILYRLFKIVVHLTQIKRIVEGDEDVQNFKNLLSNYRKGILTKSNMDKLKSWIILNLKGDEISKFKNATKLF